MWLGASIVSLKLAFQIRRRIGWSSFGDRSRWEWARSFGHRIRLRSFDDRAGSDQLDNLAPGKLPRPHQTQQLLELIWLNPHDCFIRVFSGFREWMWKPKASEFSEFQHEFASSSNSSKGLANFFTWVHEFQQESQRVCYQQLKFLEISWSVAKAPKGWLDHCLQRMPVDWAIVWIQSCWV